MDVIVIGGGVVGLATAWCLARDGHRVRVLERDPEVGRGTSFANGGQLSYAYVAPLADPGVWAQLPKLLTDPNSPVRFRPGFDLFQYRWLLKFLSACTPRRANRTIDHLGALAALSRAVLHESPALRDIPFEWTQTGKLVVYSDDAGFAAARAHADHQVAAGTDRRALGREACLELEPALHPIAHRLVGGLYAPGDEAGDAWRFSVGLARLLGSDAVLTGTTVTGFETSGRRIAAVETDRGRLEADCVVLAAGLAARPLARGLGIDLPIYPLKGYSATAPIGRDEAAPRVSITDARRKVVYARLGKELRLAGAADLVGESLAIDARRTGKLLADARADFPDAADWSAARLWAGLRPATPTGMPILGPTRYENLVLNVGHGALGFTLALGAAETIASHLGGRPSPVDLAEFR